MKEEGIVYLTGYCTLVVLALEVSLRETTWQGSLQRDVPSGVQNRTLEYQP